ncbi:MAG TPA: hypothetical protein VEL06_12130 [Haliangiales bacterium]|nr:hypothetical protein [Haliangiales bacterium]
MNEFFVMERGGPNVEKPVLDARQRSCFVIMPFSKTTEDHTEDYWTEFFEKFLYPAISSQGFVVHRSEAKTGKISKDIVHDLAYCDLVFAVLTDNNPNVWYELGIRHTSRLGTVLAIQKGQKPAFDVRDYGIIFYDDKERPGFDAELTRHIDSTPRRDNPVADFLKIESSIAINVAISALRKAVRLIEENSGAGWEAISERLKVFQQSLNPQAQVSVVHDRRFKFHRDVDINSDPFLCWVGVVRPDVSFLHQMLQERNGLRIGQVKDRDNRMTVIAFETLRHPECLVVAEGHYCQEGPRPY